mmetsp:Transcript_80966/g.262266  ORF Transcript_80966/g.262266 Transcript_80966/m.262266 type:complete len:335 (-) Transcript_80966:521-1525(-)
MSARLVVQQHRRKVRPVHLGCDARHLCVADAGAAVELFEDCLAKLLVCEVRARGAADLLAGPMEEHAVLRVPHPLADADRQEVLQSLCQPVCEPRDATTLELGHRDRHVQRLLPQLDAYAEVPASVYKSLRVHLLRQEVPAKDRSIQQRLHRVGLVLVHRGVDASGHGIRKVILDKPEGLLRADVALVVALQRVAEHCRGVAIADAVDRLCALRDALNEFNLVRAKDPATIALRDQVQGRIVLVGDPIILGSAEKEHVLHAVGGRVHRQVQCDAIVPAPDHLPWLLAALEVGHVKDPQLVADSKDFEDTFRAEASEQPATARHCKGHVGALVEA